MAFPVSFFEHLGSLRGKVPAGLGFGRRPGPHFCLLFGFVLAQPGQNHRRPVRVYQLENRPNCFIRKHLPASLLNNSDAAEGHFRGPLSM